MGPGPIEKSGRTEALGLGVKDTKRLRLRAVGEEKDAYSKYINKGITKKILIGQIILAALIGTSQVITTCLVVGEYDVDYAPSTGVGIWTSIIVFLAAIETLWCLRMIKYWKLHLSFALHIFSVLALLFLLTFQLGSNIPHLRHKTGRQLHKHTTESSYYRYDYDTVYDPGLLITSLTLNAIMTFAGLIQLISSFMMTIMTGRAICCGTSKTTGKFFELEIAGSENKEGGMFVVRKGSDIEKNGGNLSPRTLTMEEPPSYCTSMADVF